MNIFFKQFFNEKLNFTSPKSADEMNEQMLNACNKDLFDMSAALSGVMYDDGYFKFTRKWQAGFLRINGLSTSISGNVLPGEDGCIVKTILRPVLLYPIVALLFFIGGIVTLVNSYDNGLFDPANLKIGLICLFVFPGMFGIASYLKKERLRIIFVETFDLSEQTDDWSIDDGQ